MKRSFISSSLAAAALYALASSTALAGPPPGARPPLPPEALSACQKAREGDTCSVTFHDRTLQGTCRTLPDRTQLACLPAHPSPPAEAFEACAGASADDPCSVRFGDRELEGTCEAAGDDGLACRPSGPPPAAP
jgi:hypothetical protein